MSQHPAPSRPGPSEEIETARDTSEDLTEMCTLVIARAYEKRGTVWNAGGKKHLVREVARWLEQAGRLKGEPEVDILARLLDAFFADEKARKARFPFAWFAREPSQFDLDVSAAPELTPDEQAARNASIFAELG